MVQKIHTTTNGKFHAPLKRNEKFYGKKIKLKGMHPKMPWLWVVPICLPDMGSTLLTTPLCPPSRVTLLLPFIEK